jgi:hypothetical protein
MGPLDDNVFPEWVLQRSLDRLRPSYKSSVVNSLFIVINFPISAFEIGAWSIIVLTRRATLQIVALNRVRSRQTRAVHAPPGHILLAFAEFFFAKQTVAEILGPAIYDMRGEHAEALAERRWWKAKWVRIRGTWSFLKATGLLNLLGLVKTVVKVWKLIP